MYCSVFLEAGVIMNVLHPISAMFLVPGDYEVISEMGPTICLNSFWATMSPQNLPSKAQDGVLGGSMVYRVCFQPPGSCFHYGEYVVLVLAGSWQWSNIVNLLGLLISKTEPLPSIPGTLYSCGSLDFGTCFTFMGDLHGGLHGQVHTSITSPSVCCIES